MSFGHSSHAGCRHRHPRTRYLPMLLAAWLGSTTALAVTPSPSGAPDALAVANPATPVSPMDPLTWPSTPVDTGPAPAADRAQALAAWQRANARVAEFPRGHADLLKWEAAALGAPKAPVPNEGASFTLAEALQRSLRLRPDLLASPDLAPAERVRLQSRWADHVRQVQTAWLAAVTAHERHRIAAEVLENARLGAELGRRMVQAGNWSQARQLREQMIETRARQGWMATALERRVSLEQLARLTGVWDNTEANGLTGRLPPQLPAAPAQVPQAPDAQAQALARWPGLDTLRAKLDSALPLPGMDAWDDATDRAARDLRGEDTTVMGDAPAIHDRRLFNNHRIPHTAELRGELLREATVRRSQVREAEAALQAHHALARLAQDELVARQRLIEQETLLRYNGMLMSTWDLLAAARDRLAALDEATQARHRYWQAEADWRSLLAGGHYPGAQAAGDGGASGNAPEGH